MNAGLPGTGIGGLFYIASALWMPVHRALRGHASGREWQRVFAQGLIACGILWSLAAVGWLLGQLIAPALIAVMPSSSAAAVAQHAPELFRWVALFGTAGLLLVVLCVVEMARLFLRRRPAGIHPVQPRVGSTIELPDVA